MILEPDHLFRKMEGSPVCLDKWKDYVYVRILCMSVLFAVVGIDCNMYSVDHLRLFLNILILCMFLIYFYILK